MSRVLAPRGRLVIADANRRHPAVFVGRSRAPPARSRSHVGFRSPTPLMRELRAAGFARASACTVWGRGYAFVRAEKPCTALHRT